MKPEDGRRKGGFNKMTPERRKEIAAMGGRAAHRSGNAYEYTPEKAKEAAKKMWVNRQRLAEDKALKKFWGTIVEEEAK